MGYRRTVRCHMCYQTGHNQRTCPKLREQAAENPNGYAAQVVAKHDQSGRDKKCSYCNQQGHNKQTCQDLLNDRVGAVVKNQQFRKNVFEKFQKLGIGLGTLFHLNPTWSSSALLMVDEIRWDEIIHNNADKSIMVNNHGEPDEWHSFTVGDEFFEMIENGTLVIEVPAAPDNIGVGKPDEWEKGMSNVKKAFRHWD